MKIERINTYSDPRFTQRCLFQHNCFLADGEPCSCEIISDHEAIIRYQGKVELSKLIDEFRFYSCHITTFYDEERTLIAQFPRVKLFSLDIKDIQPSQFYVDKEKLAAVRQFISSADDIIIPVLRYGERFIALDGHTRLYLAHINGWTTVKAVEEISDSYIFEFVHEAELRKIFTAGQMELVDHNIYEIKWNGFCNDFFASTSVT